MKIIAITGGIATGKSTVAKMLSSFLKAEIIDADKIVHEISAPGEKIWAEMVETFGKNILKEDLHIDTRALGQRIFTDGCQRKKLERIIHPAVKKVIKERLKQLRKNRQEWVIMDIPLLFEAKMEEMADKIIVVARKRELQIETLCELKKLSVEEAENRIDTQMPLSEKVKLADFVVDNNGKIRETEKQIREMFFSLKDIRQTG